MTIEVRVKRLVALAAALTAAGLAPDGALAQKRPVQLSLVTPVQIFPEEDTIAGVRLNILYGRNAVVNGVDVGIVNRTTQISRGIQWGIVGMAHDFQGWQYHAVSISKGKFEGVQWGYVSVGEIFRGWQAGLVNVSTEMEGYQSALVNYSKDMTGFQLSLVNYAHKMKGLQVGLINIIEEGGMLPVFPIFNIGS